MKRPSPRRFPRLPVPSVLSPTSLRLGGAGTFLALAALFVSGQACGDDAETPRALTPDRTVDGAVTDAGVTDAEDADAEAPPPDVSPYPPVGLAAMSAEAFERLPWIRRGERAYRSSSFDRTGKNDDLVDGTKNVLYVDEHGDRVLVDSAGPGCVYRFWFTLIDPQERIRVYFDGETTPRIDMLLQAMFNGANPPFSAPLAGDEKVSSGGYYSYLPLPFSKSIKITTTSRSKYYFQIDYHLFDSDVPVTTWTGAEDASAAATSWKRAGADPKPTHADAVSVSNKVSVPAGKATTLLDVDGPRSITRLHLAIPGISPPRAGSVTDGGRAFKGASTFEAEIDPNNEGVVLQRRFDHSIPDQKATVFVDGAKVGTWFDRGTSQTFRDSSFVVPEAFTKGKSTIAVRVAFESGAIDWNEFHYWIHSRVDGADVPTDEIDVADDASEAAHHYAVTDATFSGSRTFPSPDARSMAGALADLWIRATWDDDATPSVEAPVGAFFAQGSYGPGVVKGLAAGVAPDGVMYAYFPMPFAKHAKIELVAKGATSFDDVWYDVRHRPFTETFDDVGHFATSFHAATPSTPGKDLTFLDVEGAGSVVGVVQSENGPPIRGYLEGDDRVHVDGQRTPQIHGTGTEDLYTGGFYFSRGPYTLPLNGNPVHYADDSDDGTSMYRFFFPDVIPFQSDIRFTIEHGPLDDIDVDAWTLAYYYAQPSPRLELTDELAIGDAASEAAHAYTVDAPTFEGERTYSFEGEDSSDVTISGKAHRSTSSFELAIAPDNEGVLLRRVLDQHIGRQRARVFVDGELAGEFYTPGANPNHAWKEDEKMLPAALTSGKTKIAIRIEFVSSDSDWNEFGYRAFSYFGTRGKRTTRR